MKKIAILGSMHSDGYKIFEAAGFDFFEVKDFFCAIYSLKY